MCFLVDGCAVVSAGVFLQVKFQIQTGVSQRIYLRCLSVVTPQDGVWSIVVRFGYADGETFDKELLLFLVAS